MNIFDIYREYDRAKQEAEDKEAAATRQAAETRPDPKPEPKPLATMSTTALLAIGGLVLVLVLRK